MHRRTAIRNVALYSAGAVFLPSCLSGEKSNIPLNNLSVTAAQEKMLASLAASLIPSGMNFTGAAELRSHEFVLTMVDDCFSPEDRALFMEGMVAFDKLNHEEYGQLYTGYIAEQKQAFLSKLEKKEGIPEIVLKFYGTVKRYTLQSFTSSKDYLLTIRHYQMVPGPDFKGCVPLNTA